MKNALLVDNTRVPKVRGIDQLGGFRIGHGSSQPWQEGPS